MENGSQSKEIKKLFNAMARGIVPGSNKMNIKRIYAWIGFVVFWGLVVFIVWSMFAQDRAINMLVNIFS